MKNSLAKIPNLKFSILLIGMLLALLPLGQQLSLDETAKTVFYLNKPPNAAGDYNFEYQTSNGITMKMAGNKFGASGVVQYISLEGIPFTMVYTADADGYHPNGEHIPKLPDHIRASLEYIRTHPPVNEFKSRKF